MKNLEVNKKLLQSLAKKGSSLVLVSSLLLATPNILPVSNNYVYASSSEELENLTVKVGINLYLNDKGFIPKDVNGNETYPFILNGTTYVPIRAIAGLFNANIGWDESSNTVSINTTGESAKLTHTPRITQALVDYNIGAKKGTKLVINGVEVIPKDANGNIKDIYVANGTTYVPVRAVSEALGLPITWSDKTNSVFIGNHKSTDLTVENINDPEYFDKCGRDFIKFDYQPLETSYYYDGRYYGLKKEMREASVYPPEMTMYLLNIEYCTEDIANSIFKNYDYDTLNRVKYFFVYLCDYIGTPFSNIQFNKYMIEQDKADFLTKVQEAAIKCNPKYSTFTGDFTQINQLIDEYFYDNNAKVSYGCDYVLDYLMSEFSILTVREYDNERSDYDELGKLTMQTRKVVYSTIETAYENTHSKELTK